MINNKNKTCWAEYGGQREDENASTTQMELRRVA